MAERKKTNGSLALEDAFLKLVTVIQTIELRQSGDHPIEDIVRPHEAKRIQYAFDLIHETRRLVVSKAEERREKYRHFLLQLKDDELVVAGALGLGQTAIGNMKEAPRLRLPIKLKQRKNDFGSSLLASLAQAYSKKDVTRTNNASKEKRTLPPAVPISSSEMQPIPTTPPVSGSSVIPFENLPSTSETRDPEYQQRNSSFSPRQEERPLEAGQNSLRGRVFALTHEDVRAVAISSQITGQVWMTDPYDNASFSFITVPITDEISFYFSTRRRQIM